MTTTPQGEGKTAPVAVSGEIGSQPIPLEFYQWLYGIERDVRVWDLTPNEIASLIAALTRSSAGVGEDEVERIARVIAAAEGAFGPLGSFADNSPMRDGSWGDYLEDKHEEWRRMARAAIEAIAPPPATGLVEAVEYAIAAVGKEADHAMKVQRASRWVVEEIEAKERRFKDALASLAARKVQP